MKIATLTTFAASLLVGGGAALAIAATAAVGDGARTPRSTVSPTPLPLDIVRLEPVVVTISNARFEEVRAEETALARAAEAQKVKRG